MIENTSWEEGEGRGEGEGAKWSLGGGEGAKAPAQTTLQGIRAHPGSRMVSLKNFSNHF